MCHFGKLYLQQSQLSLNITNIMHITAVKNNKYDAYLSIFSNILYNDNDLI